ncbi:histidine kinase [Limnobacter humi]|uniref:histidine kinase n=1 Tax=Limnobacter humi TaxID=1778671 RepID=A0ABT1WGJ1_9BURK|nr:histidine kinase [Limnobacter humi]MCQ8896643.1 histidine kinase [Limnobacter humi]
MQLQTLLIKRLLIALGLWAVVCGVIVFGMGRQDVTTEYDAAHDLIEDLYSELAISNGMSPTSHSVLRDQLALRKAEQEKAETRRELLVTSLMLLLMAMGSGVVVWWSLRGALNAPLQQLVNWLKSIETSTDLQTQTTHCTPTFQLTELQNIQDSVQQLLRTLEDEQLRNRELLGRVIDMQERERASIAQELHDELGQMLTSISVNSAFLSKHSQGHAQEAAQAIQHEVQQLMVWLRSSLRELKPHLLLEVSLRDAVLDLVDSWSKRKGWFVDFAWSHEGETLGLSEKTALYRVLQEALTNAAKHAESKNVRVLGGLDPHTGEWVVMVDNDQVSAGPIHPSLGLTGIQERVQHLGGQVRTDRSGGQFCLTARIPMNAVNTGTDHAD